MQTNPPRHPIVSTSAAAVRAPTITVGLRPHPACLPAAFGAAADEHPAAALGTVLATMHAEADGSAVFEFRIEGRDLRQLRLPSPAPAGAADELWKHTCFEAFLAVRGEAAYREFNFSPSGQWAAYAFRAWRERIADFVPAATPLVEAEHSHERLILRARVPAALLPTAPPGTELQVGLAAVVEDRSGKLEYWAVRHVAAQADFHARETFVLMLKTWSEAAAR